MESEISKKTKYVVIVGHGGSGKSTVGKLIANDLGFNFVEEEFMGNPYLSDFQKGVRGAGIKTEAWFINSDFQREKRASLAIENGQGVVVDKPLFQDFEMIATVVMNPFEKLISYVLLVYRLKQLRKPDLIINLNIRYSTLVERVKKRGRSVEIESILPESVYLARSEAREKILKLLFKNIKRIDLEAESLNSELAPKINV